MNYVQIIRLPKKNGAIEMTALDIFEPPIQYQHVVKKVKEIHLKSQHLSPEKKRYANYRRSNREKICITKGFSPHSPLPDNTNTQLHF